MMILRNFWSICLTPLRFVFKIKKDKDAYAFEVTGWGHGVGFCQEGAKSMAETVIISILKKQRAMAVN